MKNGLKVKAIIVIAFLALGFFLCRLSWPQEGGETRSGRYMVVYRIDATNNFAVIKLGIRGPAAKIIMSLEDPAGKKRNVLIRKEQTPNGFTVCKVPIDHPLFGKWIITIKTTNPENIVLRSSIFLTNSAGGGLKKTIMSTNLLQRKTSVGYTPFNAKQKPYK